MIDIIDMYNPVILVFMETKTSSWKAKKIASTGQYGGFIARKQRCFWRKEVISIDPIMINDQIVNMLVQCA